MPRLPDALLPGRPFPLGATWDGLGINFAVFSAHAERIELCLFEPSGRHEIARYTMPEYTDEIWHGYLPDATRPDWPMAIERTVPTNRNEGIASIISSCCWIPMRAASSAGCIGPMRSTAFG